MKRDKGSIGIFVLIALLFMSGFLLILYASNVNKSKIVKEQFNTISDIYAYSGGEEGAYEKAYTDLRKKNKQTMTASSEGQENTAVLELTKTFNENMSNYIIYGNSIQNGIPSSDNPIEIQSVGDLIIDTSDSNYGKYRISIKLTNKNEESKTIDIYLDEPLRKVGDSADYIDFRTGKLVRKIQKVVFTGTEPIGRNSANNLYTGPSFASTAFRVISTHFKGMDTYNPTANDTAIAYFLQSRIYFYPINGFDTSADFKAWLAEEYKNNTPVVVYYQSATLTEEVTSIPELSSYEDYTKIEILTEVAPSKIEVEYVGYTLD